MAKPFITKKPRLYKPLPTLARLRKLLICRPRRGELMWRARNDDTRWTTRYAGNLAGCIEKRSGYRSIMIDGVKYQYHRVLWKMAKGRDPAEQLDHRDLDEGNNRIGNLREANTSQNKSNMGPRADNTSGFKGAYWRKHERRWSAAIIARGKRHHLGYYESAEAAHAAYCVAAHRLHGGFARVS